MFNKRKKGMIGELAANDVLTNENRADFYAFNLDRLPLQKDSFLVCQRSCSMDNVKFLSFS